MRKASHIAIEDTERSEGTATVPALCIFPNPLKVEGRVSSRESET